jgi:hypothetical protein
MSRTYSGVSLYPWFPNPWQEHVLGFDAGFPVPWLDHYNGSAYSGCNLFIQFKLSKLLTRGNAREWNYWNQPYFRFKIPFMSRNVLLDEYHQFNCLTQLADIGYLVYYATNSTIHASELEEWDSTFAILNRTPFLDVSHLNRRHQFVTFTEDSSFFLLFSKPVEINRFSFEQILLQIQEGRKTDFAGDIRTLKDIIINFEQSFNQTYFRDEMARFDELNLEEGGLWFKLWLISKYLLLYFNLYWFKLLT